MSETRPVFDQFLTDEARKAADGDDRDLVIARLEATLTRYRAYFFEMGALLAQANKHLDALRAAGVLKG